MDSRQYPQSMSTDNWILSIDGIDDFTYTIQAFNLPSVSIGNIPMPSKSHLIPNVSGDKVQFDPLNVNALLDSRFKGVEIINNWMIENARSNTPKVRDIIVTILDNLHTNQGLQIRFRDAFPINMSGADFDAPGDIPTMTVAYTFVYDYYEIVRDDI
jgi:hypothetical protein